MDEDDGHRSPTPQPALNRAESPLFEPEDPPQEQLSISYEEPLAYREATHPPIQTQPSSPLFEPEGTPPQYTEEVQHHDTTLDQTQLDLNAQSDTQATGLSDSNLTGVTNIRPIVIKDEEASGGSRKRKAREASNDNADESSDNEDYDDDDGLVPPYRLNDRPLPRLPIFHPEVKTIVQNGTELVRHFQERLKDGTYEDEETRYLLNLFNKHQHPPFETKITRIALHGDAGHGKSSFLNALLGVDISDSGDSGNSCTFVVQEFVQASAVQERPFKAVVQFFSRQACIDMVKKLFEDCFLSYAASNETEEDEMDALQSLASTALTALVALFREHRQFHDRESGEEFLRTAESKDDQAILLRLVGWTEDLLNKFTEATGAYGDAACLETDTAQDLKNMLRPFTSAAEAERLEGTNIKPCPWPFVKKVQISFDSPLLSEKISIADCPGTSDRNSIRVENTKAYLEDCDVTIVVSKIDRAIDDDSLYENIKAAYKRKRSGSVILVCTRSDDINMNGEQGFPSIISEERIFAKIMADKRRVDAKLEDIRKSMRGVRKHSFQDLRLQGQKSKCNQQKKELELQLLEARVTARNRHVRQNIQQHYREDTGDPAPLPIFCVSNTAFMVHLLGYDKTDPPRLSLEGTQILAARDHIIGIPSNGRFQSLWHHCNRALEVAIDSVEISCSTTKLKRKEDLTRTFQRARDELRKIVEDIAEQFLDSEFKALLDTIGGNESRWISLAQKKCDQWAKIKAAGHRAIVKKGGAHGTKKTPYQDWNKQIHEIIETDADGLLETLRNEQCAQLALHIAERIGDTVTALDRTIDGDPAAAISGAVQAFKRNTRQRCKQIDMLCENFQAALQEDVRIIRTRACTPGPDHYLGKELEMIYEYALNAQKEKGKTLHMVRCIALKSKICAYGGLFKKIHTDVQFNFEACLKFNIDTLIEDIDKVLDSVQHDVEQVCSTNEDDSEEGKAMRQALLEMIPAERQFLLENIQQPLKRCKDMT